MRGLLATLKSVSHEIIFFLKAGSGRMGEGPCRGILEWRQDLVAKKN